MRSMTQAARRPSIHATCLVIDGKGILIRGRSGAGKTSLALALIGAASRKGRHARLVADDRVHVEAVDGTLIGRVPATIAGLVERRGEGVYPIDHVGETVIRLVIDLVETGAPTAEGEVVIDGIPLRRLELPRSPPADPSAILAILDSL